MPYARIDVAFLRDHFETVPEKERARAIALYLELALTSAEMLLDGEVPEHVVLICAHRIGVSRSRYGRSDVAKLVALLEEAGLVIAPKTSTSRVANCDESSTSRRSSEHREVLKSQHSGGSPEPSEMSQSQHLRLRYWSDHHSSRASVDDRRKQDAERKRAKRPQQTIPGLGTSFRNGKPAESDAESEADLARGRARTRSESKTETGPRAVAVDAARDDEPDLDAPSTNGAQPAGREPDDGEALDITYLQKITPDFEGIEP